MANLRAQHSAASKREIYSAAAEMIGTLDPADREIPARFLSEHIQRELGRQQNRRSTDSSPKRFEGVITLTAK